MGLKVLLTLIGKGIFCDIGKVHSYRPLISFMFSPRGFYLRAQMTTN